MNAGRSCYQCKYRGSVPGDAHSCCHYPGNDTGIAGMLSEGNLINAVRLGIRAESHGVKNGWFFWPMNFDPVWLTNCDGFEYKNTEGSFENKNL